MKLFHSTRNIISTAIVLFCVSAFAVLPFVAAATANDIIPTLRLSGELDTTPHAAAPCAPLMVRYHVKNTGALAVSGGTLTIELIAADTSQTVFSRQVPFATESGSIRIDNVAFPPGAYILVLKASSVNDELGLTQEFTLAERALIVSSPILVKRGISAVPRVLLWLGRAGSIVQQAFAEMIVKQAFENDDVYFMLVDTAEDFANQAMNGAFNTVVLFETDGLLEQTGWLQDHVARGQGLVVIGPEDNARMTAEAFGFTFSEASTTDGAMLLLSDDSGMGLAGTLPVSGRFLFPEKKGSKPAALFAGDKKPALLIDATGKGRVIVMPFSFSHSAIDAGTTSLYSLLLRAAVLEVAPETVEPTGISSIELLVSAPSGPIKARLVETLPPGTRVIWTSAEGSVKNNVIFYDLIADNEPRRLLYLVPSQSGNKTPQAFTEVFYECNKKLVNQGKLE